MTKSVMMPMPDITLSNNPNKLYNFDTHEVLSLDSRLPDSYGLYAKEVNGGLPRAKKEEVYKKLLKNRIMLISYMSKSSKTHRQIQRYVTLDQLWIFSEPSEMIRKDAMDIEATRRLREKRKPKTIPPKKEGSGVISVYDVEKPGWISFDVDYVVAANAIKSEVLKTVKDRRVTLLREYSTGNLDREVLKMGVINLMRPFLKDPLAGTSGQSIGIVPPNSGPISITIIGGGGGGGGGGSAPNRITPALNHPAAVSEPPTIKVEEAADNKTSIVDANGKMSKIDSLTDWLQAIMRYNGTRGTR